MAFRDAAARFARKNAVILGVSPDTIDIQQEFAHEHVLEFPLLGDVQHEAISAYDVWGTFKVGDREVEAVKRTTFLIDPEGRIRRVWRGVKIEGHAQEVLEAIPE